MTKLVCLRIYLKRRQTKRTCGFWGRLFGRSLSYHLAKQALQAGISYASITQGHAGFTQGAKRIEVDHPEISPARLPTCIELVGSPEAMASFMDANKDDLADALIFRMDGTDVSLNSTLTDD